MPRVSLNSRQTQALTTLLATVAEAGADIDIREATGPYAGSVAVTVWRSGEPTTWTIAPDGMTKEA